MLLGWNVPTYSINSSCPWIQNAQQNSEKIIIIHQARLPRSSQKVPLITNKLPPKVSSSIAEEVPTLQYFFLNRLKTSQNVDTIVSFDMSTAEFSVWWSLSWHISELTSFQEICCPSWPYLVVSTQVKISAIVSILCQTKLGLTPQGLCVVERHASLFRCAFFSSKKRFDWPRIFAAGLN